MDMATQFIPADEADLYGNWSRAFAAMEAARAVSDHYDETVFDPLYEKMKQISPRPDLHFEIVTASGQLSRYHVRPDRLDEWDNHSSPRIRAVAAAVRDAWLAHRAVLGQLNFDAICDESMKANAFWRSAAIETATSLRRRPQIWPHCCGSWNGCSAPRPEGRKTAGRHGAPAG